MYSQKDNTGFLIKTKATLCTALIIVWFLFFAFKYEWFFKIHKEDPHLKDIIEVSLGDMESAVYESHTKTTAAVATQVVKTPDITPDLSQNPPVNTENGTEAVALPPAKPLKKTTPVPKASPPKKGKKVPIIPPQVTPVAKAKIKAVVPPTTPKKIVEKPRAIYNAKNTNSAPAKTNNNPFSNGTGNSGKGQQGAINGNAKIAPVGGSGGTGMSMSGTLKNRGITKMPTFKDKFNQSGTIRVEVRVDKSGNCTFVRVMRSNVASTQLLTIIKNKIKEIKFKSAVTDEEEFGYIEFKFKVTQ